MKRLIERKQYMQTLRDLKDQNIIKVITGVRRCGKSTLLQMFADELLRNGVVPEQIQFYNFEDLDTLALGDIFQIHTHIKNKLVADRMNYIFLDEIQNVKDFQRLVDSLFIKKNCDVYITGSNAYLLSGELATLLTGRYIETEVLPFSYIEYIELITSNSKNSHKNESFWNSNNTLSLSKFKRIRNNIKSKCLKLLGYKTYTNMQADYLQNSQEEESYANNSSPLRLTKSESFADFIYYGGIPEIYHLLIDNVNKSDMFVESVLSTIIEKDVFERNEIRNKAVFQKVLDFILDSVGSYVSPNSIANSLKNNDIKIDVKTVMNYLEYLNNAMLLYPVQRYDIKGKGLLQSLNKFYLSDTSFRRVRLGKSAKQDMGHLLENAVYLELRRRNRNVYAGKFRNMEIDFVVIDYEGYTSYYQVAWTTITDETLARELAPLNAIRDSNPKYLLTTDIDLNPAYNGIRKLNVADWMLSNQKYGK
ncbi:MAG: ATP-binding protein [Prevotellaceae bacterium]|jgi:predicted AAA+ superfamily ATPase|nr:ATP-binding protein [Prevotellaceae bacterium]